MVDALVGDPVNPTLLALLADEELHAPALLDFEVASALRGHVLGGKLTANRMSEAVEDFRGLEIVRYHGGARPGRVLCAWGIPTTGAPIFLALDGASSESHDVCVGFLRDLVARGLRAPLLVVTDGAPGLIGAVDQVYGDSLRQRCLVHRVRNVTGKVSESDRDEVKADFWAIFDLPDEFEPGDAAVAEARRRADAFAATWQAKYPRAVACVKDDLASLTTFLRFPREHWRRIRHTNLISNAPSASRGAE